SGLGGIPPAAAKPRRATPMDPRAVNPNWSTADRTQRNVERLTAIAAQTGPLRWPVEQEPQRGAFRVCGPVLLARFPLCLLKGSLVEHAPVVLGPLGRAFAVASPTAGMAVLRAPGPTQLVTAHAATPAAVVVPVGLLNVCHVRASAS